MIDYDAFSNRLITLIFTFHFLTHTRKKGDKNIRKKSFFPSFFIYFILLTHFCPQIRETDDYFAILRVMFETHVAMRSLARLLLLLLSKIVVVVVKVVEVPGCLDS